MNTSKGQVFSHDIDVATREIDVTEKRVNTHSRTDTTVLWTSHYPELADYVSDMYDIGRKRLWLNGSTMVVTRLPRRVLSSILQFR